MLFFLVFNIHSRSHFFNNSKRCYYATSQDQEKWLGDLENHKPFLIFLKTIDVMYQQLSLHMNIGKDSPIARGTH
jgi:hypothetical protein